MTTPHSMQNTQFISNQRWISDSEPQLGIGFVQSVDGRRVLVNFPASNVQRIYVSDNSPLCRVLFENGDRVQDVRGKQLEIISSAEQDGLVTYQCMDDEQQMLELPEILLAADIPINQPSQRLFTGQLDKNEWYEIRKDARRYLLQWQKSPLLGLTGGKIELLAHQLYVAKEVASRENARALLADEVGLGKTIEAGLIIHRRLLNLRAQRVLIVAPEALIVQWLVEMMKRFNLEFRLIDGESWVEMKQHSTEAAPVLLEMPLMLCSLEALKAHEDLVLAIKDQSWDMLVVDEAHRLEWHQEGAGQAYQIIEKLSQHIASVLLLTATPEQLGREGHFARLRLLDPQRFFDYQQFQKEQDKFQPVADIVNRLLGGNDLTGEQHELLENLIDSAQLQFDLQECLSVARESRSFACQNVLQQLIDRHGTGRILFRNSRAAIPELGRREFTSYALPAPAEYTGADTLEARLQPETRFYTSADILSMEREPDDHWTDFDPRCSWLAEFLSQLRNEKTLIICHHAQTTRVLERYLKHRHGVRCVAFHEYLSLTQRDRAAAHFAEDEDGAQALICSEIGSEGRNFQFAHHLVMFDLVLNPDLIEQRIGRLDRIGQKQVVNIHAPYLQGGAQHAALRWLQNGLNSFEKSSAAVAQLYKQHYERLIALLDEPESAEFDQFVEQLSEQNQQLIKDYEQGRDRLLEMNSCEPDASAELLREARQAALDNSLNKFMLQVLDLFGVNVSEHAQHVFYLKPGNHMLAERFPHLPEQGQLVTFNRNIALFHENIALLTWDHPMVQAAIDWVLSNSNGNACVVMAKAEGIKRGSLLLESVFVPETYAPAELNLEQYLPSSNLTRCIDLQGNLVHEYQVMPASQVRKFTRQLAIGLVQVRRQSIETMLKLSKQLAQNQLPEVITQASHRANDQLQQEISRLMSLSQINQNISDQEIHLLQQRKEQCLLHLEKCKLRLDAVRVMLVM